MLYIFDYKLLDLSSSKMKKSYNLSRRTMYRHKRKNYICHATNNYIRLKRLQPRLINQQPETIPLVTPSIIQATNLTLDQQIDMDTQQSMSFPETNQDEQLVFTIFEDDDRITENDEQNLHNICLALLTLFYKGRFKQKGNK